jgi:hypothetical protein
MVFIYTAATLNTVLDGINSLTLPRTQSAYPAGFYILHFAFRAAVLEFAVFLQKLHKIPYGCFDFGGRAE